MSINEYITELESTIHSFRIIASYNYRINSRIIFRYDNAPDPYAKKLKSFPHHKHYKNEIIESEEKDLLEILEEIENCISSQIA